MSTLHLLSHSPFADGRLVSCLHLLGAGDALLLSGDAVYALQAATAQRQALELLPDGIALFALKEDIAARGLVNLPERLQQVDYPAFVELCCRYARTNAWL
ncbi:sulfur relay protein DsrH [Stutzerimonas stutzeri]|uniref:Sulfur relay protein DsrH n=1 Tax=Stutzerimonas stutzeri TaxID=316 RepID=W8R6U1_STUST|nr:sulfurtransferase complex subunit TusB [Stutzerimonas stutzeri]AHL75298.1 sulfur relay protein DsrH [Stutzerimonas stutzeri]MCQ4328155.1 sulfurtransferase complex subunit TusB [Stutzerimonas stutzeri]